MSVTTPLYYIPPQTLLYLMIPFGLLVILPALETITLVRVPRIAGQRAWRLWFAVIPFLISLGMLALTILLFIAHQRLAGDPTYTPAAFYCPPTAPLGPTAACPPPDANITQSLQLYWTTQSFATWGVIAVYAAALLGFLVLAIGRRRRVSSPAAPTTATSSSEAITEH